METPTSLNIGRVLTRVLAIAALGFAPALAAITEVTHSVSVPSAFTDWSVPVQLPAADPGLGLPAAVRLSLSAGLTANTVVENRDLEPRTIISTALATVTVSDALLTPLVSAAPVVQYTNVLEAFDLVIDFDAPSGAVNPSLDVTATAEVVWASPAVDLSGFLSSGALDFVVNAAADQFASGAVSYVFGANQFASATVTITYVYGEDDGGGGGGGGTGATLGNRVWLDTDEDGLQGDPVLEPGIAGATVDLLNGGVIVATVTTGADGSYGFTGLAAGSYVLRVTPPAGSNWVASADPDGVLTPGEALVAVTTDAVVTDADFGFAVVDRDLTSRTGIEYWACSTDRLFAAHFEVLNALPLVRRNGTAADFTGTLAEARAQFRHWLRRESGRNTANRLSLELAAFVLNVMQGKYATGTTFEVNGVALSAAEVLAEATAVLALDPYTVANDPNRRIQREWADRLEDYNRGETDGHEDDCD
jgi:hypothetical protein